jgi:hypothetical protein
MANALSGSASVARLDGDYETARARYAGVRDAYQELGNSLGLAHSLRGWPIRLWRPATTARRTSSTARLDLYSSMEDPRGTADTLTGLAHVDRIAGHQELARRAFRQAHDLYATIGDDLGRANSLWGLSLVATKDPSAEEANSLRQQALGIYERIGIPHVEAVRAAASDLGDRPPGNDG